MSMTTDLAAELGIEPKALRRYCRLNGLGHRLSRYNVRTFTDEEVARIREHYSKPIGQRIKEGLPPHKKRRDSPDYAPKPADDASAKV